MDSPAAPPAPVVYIIPAEEVGVAFARQYYTILQQSPGLVYRFYQDMSKLGRVDEGGIMSSTTTMDAINQKIQSYGSLRANIKFVDAQESLDGGVIVLVTGSMIDANHLKRNFTQTFFLAPQDKGYYVLNDIFRYVEDDPHDDEEQNGGVAFSQNHELDTPVQENLISGQSNGEVFNPCENGEVPVEEEQPEEEVQPEEEPVAEVVDEAPPDIMVMAESNVKVEPPAKKSYASIVMKVVPAAVPSPTISKSLPKMQEQQVSVASAPPPVAVPPAPSAEITENGNNQHSEVDGYSIYAKNLPSYATYPMMEEVFQKFGPIKSGGIQIKNSRGFVFGFVAFETADAAQSAIEASSIVIDGCKVIIEEKRSTTPRGKYPGRGGGGFRGEGSRGRGSYGGGRGYGRGESNRNDFGGRGGGRGYQSRNEGYQRNELTENGSGRTSRVGGQGHGPARAPRVTAQA